MCEPNDDWTCKFDESPGLTKSEMEIPSQVVDPGSRSLGSVEVDCGFTFPRGQSGSEDEDEVTEAKIRAFLDEKVSADEIVLCISACIPTSQLIQENMTLYTWSNIHITLFPHNLMYTEN